MGRGFLITGVLVASASSHHARPTQQLLTTGTGRVIRRLEERFAPGLGTATWGRFEVPDPASGSGWRIAREFRLTGIRRPPAGS